MVFHWHFQDHNLYVETFLKTLGMCRWELGFKVLIGDNVVYPLKSIWKRTVYEISLIYVIFSDSYFFSNVNFVKLLCSSMPFFPQIGTSLFKEQI